MAPKPVFIYCLKDPTTGDVRYIGKTDDLKRRLRAHLTASLRGKTHLGNWLRSLKGVAPVLAVLHEVIEGESWQEEEKRYVCFARGMGMNLVNGTDGGEGVTMTPEIRGKIGTALRGVPRSPEICAALSVAHMGMRHSPEHCAAISAALTGVPRSPETCAAISAAKKGVPASPAQKRANAARKGVRISTERCAAISAALTGRPWSPARRATHELKKLAKSSGV